MMSALLATPTGLYRQPCACASRVRLAARRAEHLRQQARTAQRAAESAEREGDNAEALDLLLLASGYLTEAREIVRAARAAHPACLVCASTGEVHGNGTYGGGHGRRTPLVVLII